MRYFNYLVIVIILVVSALLGKGYLGGGPLPALQADLKSSLDAFWQNQGTQVEVLGTPAQAEVRASVAFPADTGPRQQQWMNALIPFVARRHPGVKLGSVRVVPLALESKAFEADSTGRPAPLEGVAQAETAQRNLQSQLDSSLGAGKALLLVDAQPVQAEASLNRTATKRAPAAPMAAPHSLEGAPYESEQKSAPAKDRAVERAPDAAPRALLVAVLVVQTKEDAAKASNLVGPSLNGLRVVLLP